MSYDPADILNELANDDPLCSECGDPLVHPEDIADGMHFMCDPTLVDYDDDDERERPFDEGGESG